MAAALGWPLLADPLSGCRVPGPLTVASVDGLLRVAAVGGWRPEVVVRLGRPWASRVVATWLAGLGPDVTQIVVDPYGRWPDPERAALLVLRCDPTALAVAVAAAGPEKGPADWAARWARAEAAAQEAFDRVLGDHGEVTEPGVARTLGDGLPAGATLFASSSMPVRDVEWYMRPRHGVRVLANRGANGIDGVISTALGVAVAAAGPTVALLGDLAFLYDAGALLVRPQPEPSCTLVVVDNDGGGIFSFLPQAAALPPGPFERLWGTPHGADLAAIARAYGRPVTTVHGAAEVAGAVREAVAEGGVGVVLARTDRRANVEVHDMLHAAAAEGVIAALSEQGRPGR
jgi:2-succinyl-5-enolpyruvyl-6-hydroxy-3-cyclohexene-1-carboxylate synthase